MMDISDRDNSRSCDYFEDYYVGKFRTLYFTNQTNSDYRIPLATVNLPDYRQSPECVSCQ